MHAAVKIRADMAMEDANLTYGVMPGRSFNF